MRCVARRLSGFTTSLHPFRLSPCTLDRDRLTAMPGGICLPAADARITRGNPLTMFRDRFVASSVGFVWSCRTWREVQRNDSRLEFRRDQSWLEVSAQ
jgi:hypothetical protein